MNYSPVLSALVYPVLGKKISFYPVSSADLPQLNERVNIYASGTTIADLDFSPVLLQQPAIFVNGSISLSGQYDFEQVVGYVISDARFIAHSLGTIEQFYQGQPFFITQNVLEALIKASPQTVEKYQHSIRLIFAIDRPFRNLAYPKWLAKIFYKTQLEKHLSNQHFVIKTDHQPVIGVSLNITQGFVETGTVTFIATQLAYAMRASEIHIFGMDLLNSHQPRFYENQQNQAPSKLDKAVYDRIVPSFDLLAQTYAQQGIKVYNHSAISKDLFQELPYAAI